MLTTDRRLAVPGRVVVAAAAAFMATLAWRFFTFTGFTNDHYAHLSLAQQLLLGDRPIRDFTDPGWPLTYLISAGAWRLFGSSMGVEWAVSAGALAIAASLTLIAAFWLSRSVVVALIVTAFEIVIYPRTYCYPKLLPYALAALVLIAIAVRPSYGRVALAGVLTAIAFLLRHDHGLYLGVGALVCTAFATWSYGIVPVAKRVATLGVATAAALLPWLLFVSMNGGLRPYFDKALEFSRMEAEASNLRAWPRVDRVPGRPLFGAAQPDRPLIQVEWRKDLSIEERHRLESRYHLEAIRDSGEATFYYPHDPSRTNLQALDDDPHVAGTTGLGRAQRPAWREWLAWASPLRLAPALHSTGNRDAWLFWLFWTLPVVCLLVFVARRVRGYEDPWRGETAALLGLVVIALLVDAGFLRDVLRTRFSDAIVPPALLGAWLLGLCWRGRSSSVAFQRLIQLTSIAIVIVTASAVASVGELRERWERTNIADGVDGIRARALSVSRLLAGPHRQAIAPPSYASAALMPFFSYLDRCAAASERLLVTGEFPDVVVLAGRRFASDGVVMASYSSRVHQQQTVEGFKRQPPLFVVYIDAAPFRTRFPDVERYIATNYRRMATVTPEGPDEIAIFVDRRRPPSETDRVTKWPCYRTRERRAASNTASIMLDGSATPLPAMSNAVP